MRLAQLMPLGRGGLKANPWSHKFGREPCAGPPRSHIRCRAAEAASTNRRRVLQCREVLSEVPPGGISADRGLLAR